MKKLLLIIAILTCFSCKSANVDETSQRKSFINNVDLNNRVSKLEKENYLFKERFKVLSNDVESVIKKASENEAGVLEHSEVLNKILNTQVQILAEIEKLKNTNSTEEPVDTNYTYPDEEVVSDYIPYPAYSFPTSEPTDYLEPFNDAETGAEIVRISDPSVMGGNGQELGINYSSNAAFNNTGTLVKLNKNGGIPAHIIRVTDGAVLYTVSNIPPYAQWSNLQPLKMYGTTNSNEFCVFDVSTNIRTTQFTFSNYSSVSIGKAEGRQDINDQYICLVGNRNGSPNSNAWLIVYDIQDQSIYAELDLGNNGSGLDNAGVSYNGNYVVANWETNGSGSQQGFKVYDIDLTNEKHLWDDSEHSDCGCIDVNGDEVLVAFAGASRPDGFSINMVRLSDTFRKGLWEDASTSPTGGIWGGFVSCTNFQRNGYAYISEGYASNTFLNKIVALKLTYDDSNVIEVFGTHHSNPSLGYGHQSKGSVNPFGTIIAFNSNWGDSTLESYSHAPAWLLKWNN